MQVYNKSLLTFQHVQLLTVTIISYSFNCLLAANTKIILKVQKQLAKKYNVGRLDNIKFIVIIEVHKIYGLENMNKEQGKTT